LKWPQGISTAPALGFAAEVTWRLIAMTDEIAILGPTLEATAPADRPFPLPACATCPTAIWYRSSRRLRAFCREMRVITWQDGEQEAILECDGREAALLLPDERPA
jgi:hypothetical protein